MERLSEPEARRFFVGTAGWSIPRDAREGFPPGDSVLARYAGRLNAVEINSTFYRPHRLATLERWAQTVGPSFRFSLKVPKAVTHEARLVGAEAALDAFVDQALALGDRCGPLLLQLPPSLAFDPGAAGPVIRRLRAAGFRLACEPRHASWFTPEAGAWLRDEGVARVAADPALHPGAGEPGGWHGLSYWRLHGSPRVYSSAYGAEAVAALAARLQADPAEEVWCVFDNTASGAATADALALAELLAPAPAHPGESRDPSAVSSGTEPSS